MATDNTMLPNADTAPQIETGTALPDSIIPTHKLDADNYMAEDLDGITESLFGSGNLNYLLLQGRQSDAAGVAGGFDGITPSEIEAMTALAALMNAGRALGDAADLENALSARKFGDSDSAGKANIFNRDGGDAFGGDAFDNLRALTAESDFTSDVPPDGTPPSDDPPTDNPPDDNPPDNDPPDDDPPDDNPPDDDPPDDNPPDDDPPDGEDDIDVLGTNDINLPVVDINLDPLEDIVGDIDLGVDISHGDDGVTIGVDTVLLDIPVLDATVNLDIPLVNPVVDAVLDITDPILGGVTETAQPVVDGIGDTVESIIDSLLGVPPADGDVDLSVHQDLGLPQIDVNLDVVEDIVGDIDIVADIDRTDDGVSVDVDTIVADIPLVNADVDLDVPVVMPVVNGAVDPVAELLDNVTSAETLENLVDNPAEALGDIVDDVVETVGDTVEGAVAGLQESIEDTLSQIGQQDNSADDVDIAISTPLPLPPIEISLDPIEQITGDIDLGLGLTEEDGTLGLDLDTVLAGVGLTEGQAAAVDVPVLGDTLEAIMDPDASPEDIVEETVESLEDTVTDLTDTLGNIGNFGESGVGNITDGLEEGLGVLADTVEDGVIGGDLLEEIAGGLDTLGVADTSPDDTDIDISNNIDVPQVDIVLDTIENIVGDVDVGIDLGVDANGIDLGVDLVALGLDITQGEQEVDIPLATPVVDDLLDSVTEILGTAASDETEAEGAMGLIDSVTQGTEDLLSGVLGGTNSNGDTASWPQLNTDGAGGIAGVAEGLGLLGGNDGGDGILGLPDPIGNLTEGFGLLSGNNDHTGGPLSGLTSGLGGGLFG